METIDKKKKAKEFRNRRLKLKNKLGRTLAVRALADEAGIAYHQLKHIEEGGNCTIDTLLKIEAALTKLEKQKS